MFSQVHIPEAGVQLREWRITVHLYMTVQYTWGETVAHAASSLNNTQSFT